jgi:putative transposase
VATKNRMSLLEQLSKYVVEKDKDFLKEALTLLINALMDAEVTSMIGAEKYERSENRNNHRNGYRQREWDTRLGTLRELSRILCLIKVT